MRSLLIQIHFIALILCGIPLHATAASDPVRTDTSSYSVLLGRVMIGANNYNFDAGFGFEYQTEKSLYGFRIIKGIENHGLPIFILPIELIHAENRHKSPLEVTYEYSILYGRKFSIPYGDFSMSGGIGLLDLKKRERFIRTRMGDVTLLGFQTYVDDFEMKVHSLFILPYELQYMVYVEPLIISASIFGNVNRMQHFIGLNFNIAWGWFM